MFTVVTGFGYHVTFGNWCPFFAGPPGTPIGPIAVTNVTRDSVTLEWEPPEDDGGSPLTAYVVEKRDANRMSWQRVDKISDTLTSINCRNLSDGCEYFFRVFAINKAGSSEPLEMDKPVLIKSPYGEWICHTSKPMFGTFASIQTASLFLSSVPKVELLCSCHHGKVYVCHKEQDTLLLSCKTPWSTCLYFKGLKVSIFCHQHGWLSG